MGDNAQNKVRVQSMSAAVGIVTPRIQNDLMTIRRLVHYDEMTFKRNGFRQKCCAQSFAVS